MRFIYIIIFAANIVYCQALFVEKKDTFNISIDTSIAKNEYYISIVTGINFSGFQDITSDYETGYLCGLTFHYNINESFKIDISGLITRQRIFLKNRRTAMLVENDVRVIFYDSKISFLFLDLPVSVTYKFGESGEFSTYFSLGFGYNAAYSDDTKNINFITTDEILNIGPPVDEFYVGEVQENSGGYYTTGIGIRYGPGIFNIIYKMKNYKLQGIDKTYSVEFLLGYSF